MIDLDKLIQTAPGAATSAFDELSRYRGLGLLTYTDHHGQEIRYLERRFVPAPETLAEVGRVVLGDRDRLDVVAAAALADARWWWRLADANRLVDPAVASGPGAVGLSLRITLPAGMTLPLTR
jgi:hypothetical protein